MPSSADLKPAIRHDWTSAEVQALYALPFNDLLFKAHSIHRDHFSPNEVQVSTLLSIKTGACPEDCAYCPQSTRFDTGLTPEALMEVEAVIEQARAARSAGSSRFCMGAAWRSPKDRDLPKLIAMVSEVKALGLETCMTLGMLTPHQAQSLADAGLDYYNHNLDTSESYYQEIITTRTYQDRLDTLANVRDAGMKVCCGGIIGMGETQQDRVGLLLQLANLPEHPQSVPINQLVRVAGTPLEDQPDLSSFDFIRTIAVARIMMPASHVRLSAGREEMNQETHALAYFAGANSIFYGEKLLTTPNPDANEDLALFEQLGIQVQDAEPGEEPAQPGALLAPVQREDSRFYNAASG